jgi:glycine oxidase
LIIITGGGIAGLSLGWQLIKLGERITVIEQHEVGSGASWAASAYLEPRLGTGAMRALEWAAIKAWPGFVRDIEQFSGMVVNYRCNGQLRLAFGDCIDTIKQDAEARQTQGWKVQWLEGDQLRDHEPHLSGDVVGAAFLPDIHWVDGRLLCKALATAITNAGGEVVENQKITRVLHHEGKITGVASQRAQFEATRVVLATAMGTNDIEGLSRELPKCRPVKGAIISLGMDPHSPLTSHLLRHPNGHVLTPRNDGRLLVGSTHEDDETSLTVAPETQQRLKQSAIDLLHGAADLPIVEATVGIRALIGDGALRLGAAPSCKGLFYSLSHAGAGYLRAPAIAEQFADFIIDAASPCPLIDRFLHRGSRLASGLKSR